MAADEDDYIGRAIDRAGAMRPHVKDAADRADERAVIVGKMLGICFVQDRIWKITTPGFVGYIAEYNDELTGYTPEFAAVDPRVFSYGGNAYYILGRLASERGWKVEEVER